MSYSLHNYRQAYSNLKKKKGYSSTIILTIGITLGALLCVLTLNHLLLVKPLPYPEQDKLFLANHVQVDQQGEVQTRENSIKSMIELYEDKSVLSKSMIAYYAWSLIETHPAQPLVNTIETVPEYFEIFSVPIIKGRAFEQSEAINNRNPVAVISYNVWLKYFDKSADILDRKIELAGMSYRIIGVISDNFVEPQIYQVGRKTDIWLTWNAKGDLTYSLGDWESYEANIFVGKLKNDTSVNQGQQILTSVLNELWQDKIATEEYNSSYVERKNWTSRVELTPVVNVIIGDTRSLALLMLAAIIGLVVIALSNVVNLLMARTIETQKQLAIHAALGAKQKHLYHLIFSEVFILMSVAVLLALFISNLGFRIMQHYFSDVLPRVAELTLDYFTFISAAISLIGFSVILAKISVHAIDYKSLNSVLASSGKGTGFQVSKATRNRLITLQVAIASLLLFASINLGIKSLEPILLSKGFSTENLYDLYLPPNKLPFPDAKKRHAFVLEIKRIFSQEPAVKMISHSSHIYNAGRDKRFVVLGVGNEKGDDTDKNNGWVIEQSIPAKESRVDQQYFSMIEQSILQGDNFSSVDIGNVYREKSGEVEKNENRVAIVNQAFAEKIQPDGQAIGRLIRLGRGSLYRIIGIAQNSIRAPLTFSEPRVFTPSTESGFAFIIKYQPGLSLSREKIVALIKQIGSKNPPYGYNSVSEAHQQRLFAQIATSIAIAVLVVILVFLVMIGLYGIVSYSTKMRRFELGTRLAIGAKPKHLIQLILKENSMPILSGLGISVFFVLTVMMTLPNVITSFSLLQIALSFIGTVSLISLISLVACYIPLRHYINRPAIYSLRASE